MTSPKHFFDVKKKHLPTKFHYHTFNGVEALKGRCGGRGGGGGGGGGNLSWLKGLNYAQSLDCF